MSSGESQQVKHQRRETALPKPVPSGQPCTLDAGCLQDSRTGGLGLPVAQLPMKTISTDGKRKGSPWTWVQTRWPDLHGPHRAALAPQAARTRSAAQSRDTVLQQVLRFLTFASPRKPRHLINRGRRKEATGQFVPICPQAKRRTVSGQRRCATR